MRMLGVLTTMLLLASCASGPTPNFFNGNYYMAGDSDCRYMDTFSPTQVRCYDSKRNFTGYRYAMNLEQMQMYQSQQAYQHQQMQALTQNVQQLGNSAQQATQAIQQSQPYKAPDVMNPAQPSDTVKCIKAGIYVNCRQ